jgi:hypothetical protein
MASTIDRKSPMEQLDLCGWAAPVATPSMSTDADSTMKDRLLNPRVAALVLAVLLTVIGSTWYVTHTAAGSGACVQQFGGKWRQTNPFDTPTWVFSAEANSVRVPDPGTHRYATDLSSPAFVVPAGGAVIEFRQRRGYSWANTIGVLELSVDDGPYADVVTAGGKFLAGGYDGRSLPTNPLGFRDAWAAAPDVYTLTRVSMPSAAAGKSIRMRFRVASTGTGDSLPGWYIEGIRCVVSE